MRHQDGQAGLGEDVAGRAAEDHLAQPAVRICEPTVKIEAPREPITINLNIKIEADVLVRVEDKAKDDIAANPDIF